MQIAIQAHGFSLTDTLEKHVKDRIRFTFSRVSGRVRRILVILSDINGPRGGIDKRCLVEVRLDGLSSVVIQDVQADLYLAIDRAAGRAERSVTRRLALKTSKRRQHHIKYTVATVT